MRCCADAQVPFFLALQALCFYIPYGLIWKSFSSRAGERRSIFYRVIVY